MLYAWAAGKSAAAYTVAFAFKKLAARRVWPTVTLARAVDHCVGMAPKEGRRKCGVAGRFEERDAGCGRPVG